MFNPTVFWLTFVAALSAELLCLVRTIAIVAKFGSPLSVCLGTILGNVLILLPVIIFGQKLQLWLPDTVVRIVVGAIFVVMGLGILFHKIH